MRYTVRLERKAERELRKLPKEILKRVDAKLQKLASEPRPSGTIKLSGRTGGGWRVRVGKYRILYRIREELRVIEVYRIRHRRDAYRQF